MRRIYIAALALLMAMPGAAKAQSIATAASGSIVKTVYGSGQVQPASQPGVYAGTDAAVLEYTVGVGDAVEAGDVIGYLKDEALDAEIAQLELDLANAEIELRATKTHTQYEYRVLLDDEGDPRIDVNTGEPLLGQYSNEISIRAPASGRIMAVYIEPGDDALAVYREKGSVFMLSTDGRMKVELEDIEPTIALDDTVRVVGEGVDTEGRVVGLTHQGTRATIEVLSDEYPMDTPVTVYDAEGKSVGEGILAINKPMAVSAYGGTVKGLMWYAKVGYEVKRDDVLARIEWDEIPLYLDNDEAVYAYAKAGAALEDAQKRRESLTLTAPVSGVVATIDAEEGADVTQGTRLMSIVESGAGMQLILKVDEMDILSVSPGQSVSLTADALPDAALSGVVQKIAPIGDTSSAVTMFDVYVTLTGETDSRVKGGMNVSGEIAVEAAQEAVTIPADALYRDGEGWYVVMEDGSARAVSIGIMTDETVQITDGLAAGERVICRT